MARVGILLFPLFPFIQIKIIYIMEIICEWCFSSQNTWLASLRKLAEWEKWKNMGWILLASPNQNDPGGLSSLVCCSAGREKPALKKTESGMKKKEIISKHFIQGSRIERWEQRGQKSVLRDSKMSYKSEGVHRKWILLLFLTCWLIEHRAPFEMNSSFSTLRPVSQKMLEMKGNCLQY